MYQNDKIIKIGEHMRVVIKTPCYYKRHFNSFDNSNIIIDILYIE